MVITKEISLSTQGECDIIDITPQVQKLTTESKIKEGLVNIFTSSSTSAITTIEYEQGCLSDLKRVLDEIAPIDREYQHNQKWGDGNGHSHVRAALMKSSFSIPVVEAKLALGTWQQLIFIDFDNRARQRQIVVQILGD